MSLCGNDAALSPVGASCRFDFTIAFSGFAFGVLPAACWLLLSLPRTLLDLRRHAKGPARLKSCFAALLVLMDVLVCTQAHKLGIALFTSGTSLTLVASALILGHVVTRGRRPSIILGLYLLFCVVFGMATIRSLALINAPSEQAFLMGAFCASYGFRVILLVLENLRDEAHPYATLGEVVLLWPMDRFFWGAFLRSRRKALTLEDLDAQLHDPVAAYERWVKVYEGGHHRLLTSFVIAFPGVVLRPAAPAAFVGAAWAVAPLLLRAILDFVNDRGQPDSYGYAIAAGFAVMAACTALLQSMFRFTRARLALLVRAVLSQAVYRKILRLHINVAQDLGAGAISSHLVVDVERVAAHVEIPFQFLSAVTQILVSAFVLQNTLGIVFVAPVVSIVLAFMLIPLMAWLLNARAADWANKTDQRTKLMTSILASFQAIKMGAYEGFVSAKYLALRADEMLAFRFTRAQQAKQGLAGNVIWTVLRLTIVIPPAVYALHGGPAFTSRTVFVALAVYEAWSSAFFFLFWNTVHLVTAAACLIRLETFFAQPERLAPAVAKRALLPLSPSVEFEKASNENPANSLEKLDSDKVVSDSTISLRAACFGLAGQTLLHDLTCNLPIGLTLVVGPVACGKSSFLNALLGEMDLLNGRMDPAPGQLNTAFAAQDPQTFPGTIRENITFGQAEEDIDVKRYELAVEQAALKLDLGAFPEGDQHSATTLSGGQRARVALARCLYEAAELYLLDDVLSAVDLTTEALIWDALFGATGSLRGKTVIMASNDTRRYHQADHIIYLSSGRIVEQGSYDHLLKSGRLAELSRYGEKGSARVHEDMEKSGRQLLKEEASAGLYTSDIDAEAKSAGLIGPWVATRAFVGYGGKWGWMMVVSMLAFGIIAAAAFTIYLRFWLGNDQRDQHVGTWIGGYVGISVLWLLIAFFALPVMNVVLPWVSFSRLHADALAGLFRAPLSFIHEHSPALLLNRFTADSNIAETEFLTAVNDVFPSFTWPVIQAALIAVSTRWVLLVLAGVGILCLVLRKAYVGAATDLRALQHAYRTPLYSVTTASCSPEGLKCIRAFSKEERLTHSATKAINDSNRAYLSAILAPELFQLVLSLATVPVTLVIACIAVVQRDSTSDASLAVGLVSAVGYPRVINYFFESLGRLEISSIAVSRQLYIAELAGEDGRSKQRDQEKAWHLEQGKIEFEKVSMRYRPELPLAVRDVSFSIPAGSRVAFCGRTGSGKSTLLSLLFRLSELESGVVRVDGRDIATVDRYTLRSSLSSVPQDALLLDMTLRDNLTPRAQVDDAAIWAALEAAQCRHFVEQLEGGLDHQVKVNGGSFSRGTRQLLALARVLLEKPRILVLDEASSSLDVHTDAAIQQVLRTAFSGVTIVTVAHRISTIRDVDTIFVMHNGRLVETGAPHELLSRPDSVFRQLAGEE